MTKLWYEGEKTEQIIFTEEDLNIVLRVLNFMSKEVDDEYGRVKSRIYVQLMKPLK